MAVSKRCGITMATRSPRCTPRRRQQVAHGVGARLQLAIGEDCGAGLGAMGADRRCARIASGRPAQRAQHTWAMLKCSGTCQRKPACMRA